MEQGHERVRGIERERERERESQREAVLRDQSTNDSSERCVFLRFRTVSAVLGARARES